MASGELDQRYYAVGMGRFYSADPGGLGAVNRKNPTSWNMYAYVKGDPITHGDSHGLGLWGALKSFFGGGDSGASEGTGGGGFGGAGNAGVDLGGEDGEDAAGDGGSGGEEEVTGTDDDGTDSDGSETGKSTSTAGTTETTTTTTTTNAAGTTTTTTTTTSTTTPVPSQPAICNALNQIKNVGTIFSGLGGLLGFGAGVAGGSITGLLTSGEIALTGATGVAAGGAIVAAGGGVLVVGGVITYYAMGCH
jgi:hypothetical protein